MKQKKILLLLADGVGLRNFAYSKFNEVGAKRNFNSVFWNKTVFPIESLGFKEIKFKFIKLHPLTDILKIVKNRVSLNLFIKKTNDSIYESYKFNFQYKSIKVSIKYVMATVLIGILSNKKGLALLDKSINYFERKTQYYKYCKETLNAEKPDMVFSTSQRHIQSVAPLLAARDLKIPTAAFIFSWDNLPKATMVVDTDYYFVWSGYMKSELLFYYPNIKENQIVVTGTPQFEIHFEKKHLLSREDFFKAHSLNLDKKYICFSGDDITTSPDDPKYLEDLAMAVERMNQKGHNLGIIFRRCPVDFSKRYDYILEKYKDIIVPIDPLWKPFTEYWDTILPTREDGILFSNIAEHSEMVVNLGSTTVFDFVSHNKPCGYFRYNQNQQLDPNWDIFKCYKFVHFRSMVSEDAVIYLDSPAAIDGKIENVLNNQHQINLDEANRWFQTINQFPPQQASERIWDAINQIST